MATKAKAKATPLLEPLPQQAPLPPCVTTQERLIQIQLLGRRVLEHVRAVAAIDAVPGTSTEARDKAVAAFHERLLLLERALEKVLEDLRLG
jgi:hypothetical protein